MEFTEFEHNDNWKIKKFPCSCCLVKPACNDHTTCDLLEKNITKIYKLIKDKKCPDCGIVIKNSKVYYKFGCNACGHIFAISDQYKLALRGE